MTRDYFDDEMRYLHEAGKAFAEAHPEQARYLNVDSVADRDPYVERLFEGFAFLAGRIHARLDDDLPQYTESLLQLLAPHFLKPVPALSIVEFAPKPGLVQETTPLEAGLEVRSEPVGEERARCRFTTTQEVRLQPLRLADVALRWPAQDRSSVRLRFALERGAQFEELDRERLRLYFHADAATASAMHLFFTRHVARVDFAPVGDNQTRATTLHGQEWVQPAGLAPEEGLLPYGPQSFSGLRLLQEYLCFRQKFWFVDVRGLDRFSLPDDAEAFDLEVFFNRAYPEDKRFGTEQVRLHCAPVVNLFEHDAEPIRVEGLSYEHRVVPSVRYRHSIEAYDVQEVVGIEEASGERHVYTPYFSFRPENRTGGGRQYTTSRRMGPDGHPVIYIALRSSEHDAALREETLSLQLRCTNGSLPREVLQEGALSQLGPGVPQVAAPRNLTRPTLIRYPPVPEQDDYFWKLISHWSFNHRSAARREAILGLLRLYDWADTAANRRRREGLEDVTWAPKDELQRGAVLRGAEVTMQVQDGHFADEGDLCLFGQVMSRFFTLYATINSFVHLTIETTPSERTYRWQPRTGSQPTV